MDVSAFLPGRWRGRLLRARQDLRGLRGGLGARARPLFRESAPPAAPVAAAPPMMTTRTAVVEVGPEAARWPVVFARSGVTLSLGPEETLLDAGLDAELALDFSCAMGGCGACKLRLLEGRAQMAAPHCLSQEEEAEGWCLACIARPAGPLVIDA
jgi:ferredoxin